MEQEGKLTRDYTCPRCHSDIDIYDEFLMKAKEAKIVSEDFNAPNERRVIRPMISQQKALLMAGAGNCKAPLLIEDYRTCAVCGTYYLSHVEIIQGNLNIEANKQKTAR